MVPKVLYVGLAYIGLAGAAMVSLRGKRMTRITVVLVLGLPAALMMLPLPKMPLLLPLWLSLLPLVLMFVPTEMLLSPLSKMPLLRMLVQ